MQRQYRTNQMMSRNGLCSRSMRFFQRFADHCPLLTISQTNKDPAYPMTYLPFIRETAQGVTLEVTIQPRASRTELVGIHEGALKLRLTAPPVEGEANRECLRFLAKFFDLPKSRLELLQGHKSRRKTILIRDMTAKQLQSLLEETGIG
jgi:uncharacterized protein